MESVSAEQLAERERRRERSDKISALLGQYLLKGWRMLEDICPQCDTILLLSPRKSLYCVACSEVDKKVPQVVPKLQNGTKSQNDIKPNKQPSSGDSNNSPLQNKTVNGDTSMSTSNGCVELGVVENIIREKIFACSRQLASTESPSEIRDIAEALKSLSEALASVRSNWHA